MLEELVKYFSIILKYVGRVVNQILRVSYIYAQQAHVVNFSDTIHRSKYLIFKINILFSLRYHYLHKPYALYCSIRQDTNIPHIIHLINYKDATSSFETQTEVVPHNPSFM